MGRVILVVILLGWIGVAWAIYRRRAREAQRVIDGDQLPARLRAPGSWTWVLFTAPLCATCGPAEQRLRETDPSTPIITVDAGEHPDLARQLRVRAAPTLLLADRAGLIRRRLAGPEAVSQHLDLHEAALDRQG